MKDKIIGCRAMTSTTSIIGNMTTMAFAYVKSMFPNGFIKHEYVSETFNPAVMHDSECAPDNYKTKYQTLFIQPVWQPGDISMELPRWHKASEFVFLKHRGTYATVLEDWDEGIFIYSIPNRLKVQMNCRIQVQTAIQAMDVQSYVSNHFDVNGYRFLNNMRVMTEIPITLIKPICLKYGWDYNKVEDRAELDKYLKSHSRNGITEGKNLSTGNISYQYSYNTNILLNYPEEPTRETRPRDLSVGESYVDFTFNMECWIPMNYLFEIKDVEEDAVYNIINEEVTPDGSLKYTIFIDTDFYKEWEDGKQLIVNQQYYPDVNVEYDEICFKELLEHNLLDVIYHLHSEGYLMENAVKIKVAAGNKFISDDDFEVDWDTLTVRTKNPMMNTTYSLLIYLDLGKVHEVEQKIHTKQPFVDEDPTITDTTI